MPIILYWSKLVFEFLKKPGSPHQTSTSDRGQIALWTQDKPSANRAALKREHSKYSGCFSSRLLFLKPYMVERPEESALTLCTKGVLWCRRQHKLLAACGGRESRKGEVQFIEEAAVFRTAEMWPSELAKSTREHKLPLDGFSMAPLWPRVPGPGGMLSDVIWRIANPARTCPCAHGRSTSGMDSARTWETEAYSTTSWLCCLNHTCFPSKHLLAFSPDKALGWNL